MGHSYALFIMLQESGCGVDFVSTAVLSSVRVETTTEEDQQATLSIRVRDKPRKKHRKHAEIGSPRPHKQRAGRISHSTLPEPQPGLFIDIAKQ